MATLAQTVKVLLANDATLGALFTGGVLDSGDFPRGLAGFKAIPKEADGVRIRPFAILRWGEMTSYQRRAVSLNASLNTLEIYAYAQTGYDNLRGGLKRINGLLHNRYIGNDDYALAHGVWVFTSGELLAEEYNNTPMMFSRYAIYQK